MPWFPRYTKPTFLKPSTTWRAVSRLWLNDKEPKFAKSTIGIPDVSVLLLDTVARDRETTEGRNEALEMVTLAQDNIVRGEFFGGGVKPLSRWASSAYGKCGINSINSEFLVTAARGQCDEIAPAHLANPQQSIRSSRSPFPRT